MQSLNCVEKTQCPSWEATIVLGTKDQGLGTKDQGPGTKDQGPGTKDQGPGTKDQGSETKDQGPGTKDKDLATTWGCSWASLLLLFFSDTNLGLEKPEIWRFLI